MENNKLCECGCKEPVKSKSARFLPGHNGRGKKRPEHEKWRISETMKRIMTPEMRQKRSETWKGKNHTEESKQKMREAAIIRERQKKENGYVVSQEVRDKLSKILKGRPIPQERKIKIGLANKGKIRSKELRKQLSISLKEYHRTHQNSFKGRSHTEESKQKMQEANTGKFRGENGPNWRGGVNSFPYGIEWTPWLIQEIKERDKYQCQNPEKHKPYKLIDVHHIDYNKQNNNHMNLITLCKRCHGKTQRKRKHWKEYYQKIMQVRFPVSVRIAYE